MKRLLFIVCFTVVLCSGCVFFNPRRSRFYTDTNATVHRYYSFKTRFLSQDAGEDISFQCGDKSADITIGVVTMNKDALYASLLDVLENTEDADKYTDIQYKFGDCNPKSERVLVADNSHFVYSKINCVKECIEDITITALTDYNELLTACSDLSDLFTVEYQSVMPYIERGFTGDKQTVVVQKVADIAQNPIKLLCTEPLKFTTTTLPTNDRAKIEFCFTLDSGRSIKAVCELY